MVAQSLVLGGCRRSVLVLAALLVALGAPAHAAKAPPRVPGKPSSSQGNLDIRVQDAAKVAELAAIHGVSRQQAASRARLQKQSLLQGARALATAAPAAQVRWSPLTGAPEVVRSPHGGLTAEAAGRSGIDVVRDFLRSQQALYGLSDDEIDALHLKGESASPKSGARLVRLDQVIRGLPVFQSETRFLLDRDGRLVRSVGLFVPRASVIAPLPVARISAEQALAIAMKSVGIEVDAARVRIVDDVAPGKRGAVSAPDAEQIKGAPSTQLVYFPLAPGVLVPAWMQVTFTRGPGDWTTLVDATTGTAALAQEHPQLCLDAGGPVLGLRAGRRIDAGGQSGTAIADQRDAGAAVPRDRAHDGEHAHRADRRQPERLDLRRGRHHDRRQRGRLSRHRRRRCAGRRAPRRQRPAGRQRRRQHQQPRLPGHRLRLHAGPLRRQPGRRHCAHRHPVPARRGHSALLPRQLVPRSARFVRLRSGRRKLRRRRSSARRGSGRRLYQQCQLLDPARR